MKLSLIICVYNVPIGYLSECLDSVARSTLSDYETVLVDDGSTVDYSPLISRYPNLRYEWKENRGLLAARLRGIGLARGEYVAFIDGDDTVSRNYHLPMLELAERTGADIVVNGWAFRSERTARCCVGDATMRGRIDAVGEEALRLFLSGRGRDHSLFVQWNKLFSARLLRKTAERLTADGFENARLTYGEDALMNFLNFGYAGRVVGVSSGFYFYRSHSGQSIHAPTEARLRDQIDSMSRIFRYMEGALRGRADKEKLLSDVRAWREMTSRTHYSYARAGGFCELYPYIRESYGVYRLSMPTLYDQSVYTDCELLGENFECIDDALTSIYIIEGDIAVCYERECRYVRRILDSYDALLGRRTVYLKEASLSVPKRRIRKIHSLVHSRRVYVLGALIFKKGSRLRACLKKRL